MLIFSLLRKSKVQIHLQRQLQVRLQTLLISACRFFNIDVQLINSARPMETLDRERYALDQQARDPIAQQVKSLKLIINSLIDAMLEANAVVLKAAETSGESDKILPASKILTEAIAAAAKV